MIYKLPVDYTKLTTKKRREVREQYIKEQKGICMYCKEKLSGPAAKSVTSKPIDWSYFPPFFLKYTVHLQHCHKTNMTEGAVHAYCNAVLWQYENK